MSFRGSFGDLVHESRKGRPVSSKEGDLLITDALYGFALIVPPKEVRVALEFPLSSNEVVTGIEFEDGIVVIGGARVLSGGVIMVEVGDVNEAGVGDSHEDTDGAGGCRGGISGHEVQELVSRGSKLAHGDFGAGGVREELIIEGVVEAELVAFQGLVPNFGVGAGVEH